MPRLLLVTTAALALALGACGDEADKRAKTTAASPPPPPQTTPAEPAGDAPAPGCKAVAAPEPKGEGKLKAPSSTLAGGKRHSIELDTNCGKIVIALDTKRAPRTAASVAALVRAGFYDGTTFHRIVPGFVIQGGDPTGTGSGGPGYSVVEAPPRDLRYTPGIVAMAKTGTEESGTSGSQFYIATGPQAETLPPDYALAGRVTKGLDVARRIEQAEVDPQDRPLQPVVIRKARLVSR